MKLASMACVRLTITVALVMTYGAGCSAQDQRDLRRQLAEALQKQDLVVVQKLISESRRKLGDRAGVPEVADVFQAIPAKGKWLSKEDAQQAMERIPEQVDKVKWWKIGLDPTKLDHALREVGAVISACVRVHDGKVGASERCLAEAREAGDFLIWAQEQAGAGCYPFPTAKGVTKDNAFVAAERYLKQVERDGRLDQVVRNGWAFDDAGDGGLQFDNGEAGVAMLELHRATGEKKYLDSAIRAADWAAARPLVTNWNYNSFSVFLLAETYRTTHDKKYLTAATTKALVGVIPGQLTDGPHAGRWLDAHNARPAYHYIMLRSLASLVAVLPKDDPSRDETWRSLLLGLKARNSDFIERGAPNKDHALQTLLFVNREFAADTHFLEESKSAAALTALSHLVSEEARRGKNPLGPRAWGMFLLDAINQGVNHE